MFKDFLNLSRQIIFLTRDVQEGKDKIEKLTNQVSDLAAEVLELKNERAFERERREYERRRQEDERDKLMLQLRVAMLEFERRLPPAPSEDKTP